MARTASRTIPAALCVGLGGCIGAPELSERPCWTEALLEAGARCGSVTVPGSYDTTDRPSRQVAFAVRPPLDGTAGAGDPVVFLIGGPGLAGTYYSVIDGYEAPDLDFLNQERPLVLVDYRGLGESHYIGCDPADLSVCDEVLGESGLGPELRAATFARDIDRVLDALGFDSVVLYGESWGTRLALTMMRDVPGRISHVVLDGVFPPEVGLRHDPVSVLANLDHVAEVCAVDAACTATLGDVRAKINTLVERWAERDDVDDLIAGVAAVAHFPAAPLLVHELWSATSDESAALAGQLYSWTHETFEDSPVDQAESFLMMITVVCAEEANLLDAHGPLDPSPYGFGGTALEVISRHTFGAPVTPEEAQALCAQLHVDAAPEVEVEAIFGSIPTLVLSGGMDLDTSFAWGALAASRLSDARHFVFPFSGHVTALRDACPRSLVSQFIHDSGGALDARCHAAEVSRARALVLSSDDVLAEIRRYIPSTLSVEDGA